MQARNQYGFTLIEVLVVVAVIAIIATFASLGNELIRRERVLSTTRMLLADLQKARLNAMTQHVKGFGVRLESSDSYVLFAFNDCNADYTYDVDTCSGSREEAQAVRKNVPSTVGLKKTNLTNSVNNDVRIFDKFGHPRHATWGMGGITIVVRDKVDPALAACVSISTNRIREARWDGKECAEL